ncbi:hypothetical protein HY571_01995 [Candidatus Micrarchaeota archaeon]|nr:hypothetical protein [Candidatus Micrarchaeota archaeon]
MSLHSLSGLELTGIAVNAITVVLVSVLFYKAIYSTDLPKAKKQLYSFLAVFLLSLWFALAFAVAQTGFFQASTLRIPNIALMFLPLAIGFTLLRNSSIFQKVVDKLPVFWLIGVQVFRLLGIYFLVLHAQGLMPAEFAFPSGYGDIIIGITALPVAYLYFAKKPYAKNLAIAWNIIGMLDLAIAIITGFFTSPSSYQLLAHELPNALLFAFPLALVPTFAVPLSILLHAFTLRILLRKK